jgi:ABC-type Zn uptake system ZnuABC Zn-binding protein ZnuA
MHRLALLVLAIVIGGSPALAQKPIRVVATLSTFADLVETVGGDRVEVSFIASPKFNPHFIEPRPSDVLKVKRADLFVHAGLDLELWRGPLLDAAGNMEVRPGAPGNLDLSRGVRLLEVPDHTLTRAEGDIHLFGNPHYWLDPINAKIMIRSVVEKLSELDPDHGAAFAERGAAFVATVDAKLPVWRGQLADHEGAEFIGYHNEWPYLMEFLGLKMERFLEPKPGVPPTPKHLEALINYARDHDVQGVVQSSYFPTRAAESFSKRSGTRRVPLCQNVKEAKPATDYIAMMDYNVAQLVKALE